jgi:hypothetical protein
MCGEKSSFEFCVPITRNLQRTFTESLINQVCTPGKAAALVDFFRNELKHADVARVEVSSELTKVVETAMSSSSARTSSEVYEAIEHAACTNEGIFLRLHGQSEPVRLLLKDNLAKPFAGKDLAFSGAARDSQWQG